jgi:hypothetical protein
MVRKSLLVAILLFVAPPLSGQDEATWSSKRPDGLAPLGVMGARMLDEGAYEFTYRFGKLNSKGVWFENDFFNDTATTEIYTVAPLALENLTHWVGFAYAPAADFTLSANMSFSQRRREQYTTGGVFYVTDVQEIGDLKISGLYNVFDEGTYEAHLELGALIPIGASDVTAETPFSSPSEEALPYDMRPGAGTFALMPGFTAQAQNEFGTVGAQLKGVVHIGTNSDDYSLGDRFDGTAWASYRANDYFSFSGRFHYQVWRGITGADPRLDPLRDPGNDSYFLQGERVDLPLGVNFYLPEGSRFEGHRLALEWIFPVHQEYDGPQLGTDWGFTVGWLVEF